MPDSTDQLASSAASPAGQVPAILCGHEVVQEGATLRVTRRAVEKGAGCLVYVISGWTVFSTLGFLAAWGLLPGGWEFQREAGQPSATEIRTDGPNPLGLVMFGLFLILGLGALVEAIVSRYGTHEWLAEENHLRITTRTFGITRTQEVRTAKLQLVESHSDEGPPSTWTLQAVKATRRGPRVWPLVFNRWSTEPEGEELKQLAEVLRERTGWWLDRP